MFGFVGTVLFIEEKWLSLLTLLKTDLLRQLCSQKLLQIGKKYIPTKKDFFEESGKELENYSLFIH